MASVEVVEFTLNEKANDEFIIQQIANIETILFTNDAWSAEQIKALLDNEFNHIVYAMDLSNKVIKGYCIYQQLFEDSEILKIGTHPRSQNQGIASQLLNSMQQKIQVTGAERIMLEVREDNKSAIAFYQKHDFKQISLRKNYYDNHDNTRTHALILRKIL